MITMEVTYCHLYISLAGVYWNISELKNAPDKIKHQCCVHENHCHTSHAQCACTNLIDKHRITKVQGMKTIMTTLKIET